MKTNSLITFVLLQCLTFTGFAQTVNIDKAFVSSEGSALYVAPVPVTPPGYTIHEFGGVYESYPVNEGTLYSDLQQASYFGYDPDYWYGCQVGCWVYASNSNNGDADLKFTISHRWASSVSGLASASWSTVMYSSPQFDGSAAGYYLGWVQFGLNYPKATWEHRVIEWKVLVEDTDTGGSEELTTVRVWFGSEIVPTPTPPPGSTPTFTPTATPTRTPTPTFTPTATATPKPKLPPVGITGEVVDYDTIHYKLLNTDFATPYNWYGTEYIQVVISIPTKPLYRLRYFTLAAIQEGGVAIWLSDDVPAGCGFVTIRARALAYSYAPYQDSDESTATILMPPAPTSTPTVPASTSTPTTTNTPTPPLGSTPTFTPTRTNTVPPTNTLTPTVSVNTPTNTSTVIPGSTATPPPTYTQTPTPTNTPTPTVPTNTPTNTATSTPTPTVPPGSTPTFTTTPVVLPPTPTWTPSLTPTSTPTATNTPTGTPTVPTSTPTSSTPSPTATPDSSYKVDVFVTIDLPVFAQEVVWGDPLYCSGYVARKTDDFPDKDVSIYYRWSGTDNFGSAIKPGQTRYVYANISTTFLDPTNEWPFISMSSYAIGYYESYWIDNEQVVQVHLVTPTPTYTPTRTPTPTFTPTKTPTNTPTPLSAIRPLTWLYGLPRDATSTEIYVMFHADSLADWPISNFASFKWGYDPDNTLTDTSPGLTTLTGIIPEWEDTMVSSGEMVFDATAVALFGANNEVYPPGRQSTWLKFRWVPTPTPIPGATPTPTEAIPTPTPLPNTGTLVFRKEDGGIGAFVESQ